MLAALVPLAAHASFGGKPCGPDFGCHFLFWGLILGAAGGLPVSAVAFVLLQLGFRHPARARGRQLLLAGVVGLLAFEVAAAFAAQAAAWGKHPLLGLIGAYAVIGVLFVLFVRQPPRDEES